MQAAILKVTVFLPWCLAFPVPPATDLKGLDFVKNYFHQLFLTKRELPLFTQEDKIQRLKQFHLNETVLQDEQMLVVSRQPHCGGNDGAKDSTFPGSSMWDKHTLTYRIINYPRDINPSTVKNIMQNAVSIWSNVTPLIFQQVKSQDADIKISFWDLGFNLFLVAIHELGHSLGLLHSKSLNSIMYPRYVNRDPRTFHLDGDDIKRIQQLYGERCSSEMPQCWHRRIIQPGFQWLHGKTKNSKP
ncbi:matrix metalloproteinase-26 isoform X3 [Canis lupus baileyi]|uniref:matrix metalloproteinase-26 isoform X3 n=1 Tax=Canis lupus familiaris TaxID=9615 RepID=UPI000BAA0C0E|nr:matrix metalloproteinase-26 isoform X3 [Canis lupus familiaris]XP_025315007.3 matrix metalloproteinase-26 isoform X3 [Canis lupus dingo]XP_038285497.1 matrix metalloproteinase-26 isoform X3 [Canis lupus familiaris]XP_038424080.1 matrix metalloproteinase-26 isoform X3 [Canis lupus familiaris]|eukprot:XP_022263471.1 matrix metalloproteinase-26 isoform X3 [Canis lupus familiaris]